MGVEREAAVRTYITRLIVGSLIVAMLVLGVRFWGLLLTLQCAVGLGCSSTLRTD